MFINTKEIKMFNLNLLNSNNLNLYLFIPQIQTQLNFAGY